MSKDANATKVVGLLIEAANGDTVYRDLYLRRARQLLGATLDESAYRAIGSTEKEIEDLMRRSRSAVLQRDWDQAANLSAQADSLRQRKTAMGQLAAIGKDVYDADTVAFDPFSPGKHLGPQSEANQPVVHKRLMDTLASLGKLDPSLASILREAAQLFFQPGVGEPHSFPKRRATQPWTSGAARRRSGGKGRHSDAAAAGKRIAGLEGKRNCDGFYERLCCYVPL